MEKRSKPAEPVPAAEAPVTVAAENVDAPPTDPVAVALTPSPDSPMLDEIGATGEEPDVTAAPSDVPNLEDRPVIEDVAGEVARSEEESVAPSLSTASVGAQAPTEPIETPQETAGTAEPELIEVWRPGRSERRRERPRFRHREARKQAPGGTVEPTQDAAVQAAVATNGASEATAPAADRTQQSEAVQTETPKPERHSRHHRRRHGADQRFDRPRREQDRPSGPPARYERREKAPDPNSPFAKLAALKAQLEADAKGRR